MKTITPEQAGDVVSRVRKSGVPVFLWGAPGVGKTAVVEALSHTVPVVSLSAAVMDPSDVGGFPYQAKDGRGVVRQPDAALLRLVDEEGILFVDEVTAAPPAVQAAFLRLVLQKEIGSYQLHPSTFVVFAGNPPEYGGNEDVIAPLANRFLHFTVQPSVQSFITHFPNHWGRWEAECERMDVSHETFVSVRSQVAAFIRSRPDLLLDFTRESRVFPSPRTWTHAADAAAVLGGWDAALESGVLEGTVGSGAAREFAAFIAAGLPSLSDVLANPAVVDKYAKRPDVLAAISIMLSEYVAPVVSGGQKPTPTIVSAAPAIGDACARIDSHAPGDVFALSARAVLFAAMVGKDARAKELLAKAQDVLARAQKVARKIAQ